MVVPTTFRATTHDLRELSPLRIDNGTGLRGATLGVLHRGGSFVFDPFAAYHAGLVSGPNIVIFGRIGSGKSAVTKMILRRAVTEGASAVVLDPKGEYSALAQQLGGSVMSVGDSGWCNIVTGEPDRDLRTIASLLGSARGRKLSDVEAMQLDSYWHEGAISTAPRPLLELLRRCDDHRDVELGSTVRRFVHGDLRGLIDGPDSPQDLSSRVMVLNLERWWGTDAIGTIAMLAWILAEQSLATGRGNRYLVADEAWSLLDNRESLLQLRGSLKLSRATGTSHILVLHRLADLAAVGDVGSRSYAAALSLLRDCDTHFIFRSADEDAATLAREFHLTETEQRYVTALPRGAALVRYGAYRSLVRCTPTSADLIDTDAAMR